MGSGYLEVQEASCGCLGVQKASSRYLEVQEAGCVCLEAQDSKKNYCDDPFQTVPGSIPGSCIPAFTGTLQNPVVGSPDKGGLTVHTKKGWFGPMAGSVHQYPS